MNFFKGSPFSLRPCCERDTGANNILKSAVRGWGRVQRHVPWIAASVNYIEEPVEWQHLSACKPEGRARMRNNQSDKRVYAGNLLKFLPGDGWLTRFHVENRAKYTTTVPALSGLQQITRIKGPGLNPHWFLFLFCMFRTSYVTFGQQNQLWLANAWFWDDNNARMRIGNKGIWEARCQLPFDLLISTVQASLEFMIWLRLLDICENCCILILLCYFI